MQETTFPHFIKVPGTKVGASPVVIHYCTWYVFLRNGRYVQVLFEKQRTIKGEKSINYIFSIFDFLELVELESLKYPREDIISVLA